MTARLEKDLLVVILLVVLLGIVLAVAPDSVIRAVLGIPAALFFPGYALTAALYPRRDGLEGVPRLALSLGLSLAVVPIVGVVLNFTPWGLTAVSSVTVLGLLVVGLCVVAWVRRGRLPAGESFRLTPGGWPRWSGSAWDRALVVLLALAVAGTLGAIGYAVASPRASESFTEFYILGADGKVADYPAVARVGQPTEVTVGIINREQEVASYRVVVTVDDAVSNEFGPVTLEPDEKLERALSFTAAQPGDRRKVEFLLYRDGQPGAYLGPLRLWVKVVP